MNMSVLGDMLNELKPGQEDPSDYKLLTDLSQTCKYVYNYFSIFYRQKYKCYWLKLYREMQGRIVELIGRINHDEITAELLRLNDEMNNLFLRHQRYEKNRDPQNVAVAPSALLGVALGVPTTTTAGNHSKPFSFHFSYIVLQ